MIAIGRKSNRAYGRVERLLYYWRLFDMNNNGFWEFANKHPFVTIFGIAGAFGGVAKIIRAAKGVPEPVTTIKVRKMDEPNENVVVETNNNIEE